MADAPRLPTFLIVGAAKSGTTALYHFLRQHPQVFMSPEKEPAFFAFEGSRPRFRGPYDESRINATSVWRADDYEGLFRGAASRLAVGEASTQYLYYPAAPERIARKLRDVRLVAILRQPAERAYSHYLMVLRDGREWLSFEDALRVESERIAQGWYWGRYRDYGYYYAQLKRYFDLFPRERIRVYAYDDLVADPRAVVRDLLAYLGVDPDVSMDLSGRPNVSGILANPLWRLLWARTNGVRALLRPHLPRELRHRVGDFFASRRMIRPKLQEETRRVLTEGYRDDILRLQDLIDRDLAAWLR